MDGRREKWEVVGHGREGHEGDLYQVHVHLALVLQST